LTLLLLDTHLLLWASAAEERLPRAARELMEDGANMLAFSVVSFFEVLLKAQKLRVELGIDPREYRESWLGAGYREIAMTGEHVVAVGGLPPLHKDPFDRLLVAQAGVEGATLLTADRVVARYAGPVQLVG
jgi:PIN domain nuclease of toxin-antitoxin system